MATLIFKISRFKKAKNQLVMAEYVNSSGELQGAAYLHLDVGFLSGLPQCLITDTGEKRYTLLRTEGLKDKKVNYNVSLSETVLAKVIKELTVPNNPFLKPTCDAEGKSLLKKFQLQIEISEGADVGVGENKDSDFITFYVAAEDITKVSIVATKDAGYVHLAVDNQTKAKFDDLANALYQAPDPTKNKTLTGVNEVAEHLATLTRSERRASNRKKAQAAAVLETSNKIVLVDDAE